MEDFAKTLEEKLLTFKATGFNHVMGEYLTICQIPKTEFKQAIKAIKNDESLAFQSITDLSASDYPDHEKRFEVIYNFLSMSLNRRLIIKVEIDDKEEIDSISDIFSAAIWYEREVWDMFGIKFTGNPDLRRILTDYGFVGHPLRKDFPLTGYKEVRYDLVSKKVIYEPVELVQEFRTFDFLSPWEGSKYVLPGDEKAGGSK